MKKAILILVTTSMLANPAFAAENGKTKLVFMCGGNPVFEPVAVTVTAPHRPTFKGQGKHTYFLPKEYNKARMEIHWVWGTRKGTSIKQTNGYGGLTAPDVCK